MKALVLEQIDGKTVANIQTLKTDDLPAGDVLVDVQWSSLNYKDALAITGKGKIIRNFPMVPGIDFAGTVHHSEDPRFHIGQSVILTGWGVGENHWGGLSEQARVSSDLKSLGAERVLPRSEFTADSRPLEKQIWAGAIDTVGDKVLAKVLAQMDYNSTVAACGLAGGYQLPTTVMPFILRNVRLQGVDSVMTPHERRTQAWERLADLLPESFYENASTEVALEKAAETAAALIDNKVTGRTLVKVR